MIKPMKDRRYNYLMVKVQFRWVDWERLRDIFPADRGESASDYFQRMAKWLQEKKREYGV
jgi:hypothetical protein